MVEVGELGGVVSGVVAAAADMVGAEARMLLLAGAFTGGLEGISLGALSCVGASNLGASIGVSAEDLEGSEANALPAPLPAGFGVRALDGAASAEKVTSVNRATAAELKRGKERPLCAAFFSLITAVSSSPK